MGEASESWFEVIGAGDIVAAKKPAPDIYQWVLRQLSLSPNECMVLEDSENGVKSARDAGLVSILVTRNGYTEDQDFSSAPYVVDQFGDPGAPMHAVKGRFGAIEYVSVGQLLRLHLDVINGSD